MSEYLFKDILKVLERDRKIYRKMASDINGEESDVYARGFRAGRLEAIDELIAEVKRICDEYGVDIEKQGVGL